MCYSKLFNPDLFDENYDLRSKLNGDDSVNLDDYCKYIENTGQVRKNSEFIVMHLNVRSLVRNYQELIDLINNNKPDVLLLCETFLHLNNVNLCHIPGYNFTYKNRTTGKGGGIAIYSKDCYRIKEYDMPCEKPNSVEQIFMKIEVMDKKLKGLVVGELYRKPNTPENDFINYLNHCAKKLYDNTDCFVLATDQNIDLLKTENKQVIKLIDSMYECEIMPMITKPTHVTKTSATLIDQIYVSNKVFQLSSSEIVIDNTSDHYPCILKTKLKSDTEHKGKVIKGRNMSIENIDKLVMYLNQFKWDSLNMFSANEAYENFLLVVECGLDKFIPEEEKFVKPNKILTEPWMTTSLLKCKARCKKLYSDYIKGLCHETVYKDYRNVLNRTKKNAKIEFYFNRFNECQNNMKKSWQLLNRLIGKTNDKSSCPNIIETNKGNVTNVNEICDNFNNFFGSVGKSCASKIKPSKREAMQYMKFKTEKSLSLQPVDVSDVVKIIQKFKNKDSCGCDGISNRILKRCVNGLCKPLTIIANKCMKEGVFPEKLKTAIVKPLHKGRCERMLTNYRPISLLPVFSKVLEKIMYDQTYEYLTENNIINEHQFGFRAGYSCQDLILKFTSDMTDAFNKKFGIAIMCDLSKAFDSIQRSTLLCKLKQYGITGKAFDWYSSYFDHRTQRVQIQDSISDKIIIDCGVGQGSILGPLVLLVMLNDLYYVTKYCKIIGFADDTTIYHVYHNLVVLYARIKYDMNVILDWFRANKLSLNEKKTNFMLFTNTRSNMFDSLSISDFTINRVSHCKLLGVIVDDKLRFTKHFEYLLNKIRSGKYSLNRTKYMVPIHVKMKLYYSFVYSHLQYCCETWGSMLTKSYLKKLQSFQNECVRTIKLLKPRNNVRKFLVDLKLLDINNMVKLYSAKIMYKIENNLGPVVIRNLFTQANHCYQTRDRMFHLLVRNPLLSRLKENWENLSNSIKLSTSINMFKKNTKDFLIRQQM